MKKKKKQNLIGVAVTDSKHLSLCLLFFHLLLEPLKQSQ